MHPNHRSHSTFTIPHSTSSPPLEFKNEMSIWPLKITNTPIPLPNNLLHHPNTPLPFAHLRTPHEHLAPPPPRALLFHHLTI